MTDVHRYLEDVDIVKYGGVTIQKWDHINRVFTAYGPDGVTVVEERPYTDEENEARDAAMVQETCDENADVLKSAMQNVIDKALERQAAYQAVINTPNQELRNNPQLYLIQLARAGKRSERAIIACARLLGELTETADTGSD